MDADYLNMKGSLKLLVLHLLKENSSNGYNLIKAVSEYFGKKPSTGTIYPLLNKLAKDGYVEKTKEGRSSVYKITERGLSLYEELIRIDQEKLKKGMDIHVLLFGNSSLCEKVWDGNKSYADIAYEIQGYFREIISSDRFKEVETELKQQLLSCSKRYKEIRDKISD
jgi:DNA-binding PadR family transcriptional regulator